ncbi:hypothetical protein AAHA92_09655 [Salvia divinorum]|uniref:Uncharacterized protein n=1 Tax=Salvia divinorum TaxID=28513 RepID=A0ABD1HVP4_SALDI
MKITNALHSPFYERAVKVSNKLNPDERIMFYWLMTTYNTNEISWYTMATLWKLFFTTYPALYTIVNPTGGVDTNNSFNTFATNLDKEVREIPKFKWGDIDMVFFPFYGDDRDIRFNYGDIPETLRMFFFQTSVYVFNMSVDFMSEVNNFLV